MPFALTMPKLSPTMTDGVIAKWHKKPGEFIESGDLILEISTDKATVEHTAIDPGWLRQIMVQEGSKAEVNAPIAILTDSADEPFDAKTYQTAPTSPSMPTETAAAKTAVQKSADIAPCAETSRVKASPLAKKLAAQRGICLEKIKGSGPRGRIMSRDLDSAPTAAATAAATAAQPESVRVEALSPMRQIIAKRLQESKATIPHFYATIDVNVSQLLLMREELKANGFSITVNDFVVKAAAMALMDHPAIRSTFNPSRNEVSFFPHADISVAVSIDGGLITPIVPAAETKSLKALSQEIKSLIDKAKKHALAPHEFIGGAFTISNLGMFGISDFQAIINPPQVAILSVGAALDQPLFDSKTGSFTQAKIMKLTISCDHRAVDGSDGAKFLQTIKKYMESPALILIS